MVNNPLTPREAFRRAYLVALARQYAANPSAYAYPASQLPAVAGKMVDALADRSANWDTAAVKEACKTVGCRHGQAAIAAYLAAPTLLQAMGE